MVEFFIVLLLATMKIWNIATAQIIIIYTHEKMIVTIATCGR